MNGPSLHAIIIVAAAVLPIAIILLYEANKKDKPSKEQRLAWHADRANWKAGLFYFNKSDPRLFPPKQISYFGWTVNFGNPYSIIATIALIGFVVCVMKFLLPLIPN